MSIKIENLSFTYMKGTPFEKKAIDNINLEIYGNQLVAIIGRTGSGKSTLIQHINGLLKPTIGCIYIDNINIMDKSISLAQLRKKVGLVFQYPEHQLFEETVEKDIAFGPKNLSLDEKEVSIRVKKAMNIVGIDYNRYKDKSPFQLSGGEKRRVAIAGVVAMEPQILILDEPTAGLDPKGRDEILSQIQKLHQEYKMTIILVSHSIEDVVKVASRVIVMESGKIILDGITDKVFKEIEILESAGLAVPQITYLVQRLRERGIVLRENTLTIEDAKNQLISILRRGKG